MNSEQLISITSIPLGFILYALIGVLTVFMFVGKAMSEGNITYNPLRWIAAMMIFAIFWPILYFTILWDYL